MVPVQTLRGRISATVKEATAWSQPIMSARVKTYRIQNNLLFLPPPWSFLLIGLLVNWLVGCAVCQILMSVLTWGRLFVGFGPVRTHQALTDVRCPAHLAFPEANTASASVSAQRHQLQPWCHHLSSTQLALLHCTSPYSSYDQSCFFFLCGLNICLNNTADCNYVPDQTHHSMFNLVTVIGPTLY